MSSKSSEGPSMKSTGNNDSPEMNWSDYCDALRSERWQRLIEAARGTHTGTRTTLTGITGSTDDATERDRRATTSGT
jgi:hypothetical protein